MTKSKAAVPDQLTALILLSYPALLLTVQGGMSGMFILLLLVSLYSLFRSPKVAPHWDAYAIAFALAMASPVIAIFLSQAHHGEFRAPPYDWAARFLFAVPIFLALRQMNLRSLSMLQYGVPAGILIGLVWLLFHPYNLGESRITPGVYFNLLHFADTALALGFLSLFAIHRDQADPMPVLLLKFFGFIAGLYMAIQSAERGLWLAIPPLVLLWVYGQGAKQLRRKLGLTALLLLVVAVLAYFNTDLVHQRTNQILQDLSDFDHGNKDTSIGVRLQLWHAAVHVFMQNPIFGLGPDGYANVMSSLAEQGMLTPVAADYGRGEVHSEILAKCAGLGIFGLIAIIAVHLVPGVILWRSMNTLELQKKIACLMGLGLVISFFIFGLTVEIFNLKMTAAFYALTLAVLVATTTNHNQS